MFNLVPRVFSAFNMAAGLGRQHSRSRDQDLSIEDGQICKFFQNGGKESGYDNCQQTKWSTKGELCFKKPKIRMDECTSNENAVDDREILLFFSFHVILNQCNFIDGYYFSRL